MRQKYHENVNNKKRALAFSDRSNRIYVKGGSIAVKKVIRNPSSVLPSADLESKYSVENLFDGILSSWPISFTNISQNLNQPMKQSNSRIIKPVLLKIQKNLRFFHNAYQNKHPYIYYNRL